MSRSTSRSRCIFVVGLGVGSKAPANAKLLHDRTAVPHGVNDDPIYASSGHQPHTRSTQTAVRHSSSHNQGNQIEKFYRRYHRHFEYTD